MSFVRDRDARTRQVGAIAAIDKVSGAGRARARAQAKLLARRDQLLSTLARSQPLSGDVAFSNVLTRIQPTTWHPPKPPRDVRFAQTSSRGYQAVVGHPPKPVPVYRRTHGGYEMMGAVPVNPLSSAGPTRRPTLDPGGAIEGEGKSRVLGRRGVIITGTTPPAGGGSPPPPIYGSSVGVVIDSMKTPLAPGKKPIRPSRPRLPQATPPQTPSPVVLLPVPNVTVPYPGSPGGGGGGGGSSAPLPEPDEEPVMEMPIVDEPVPMSTGKKVAIAAGILGGLYLLYENFK